MQDVPYDYYLTPGSTALAASGPGQTAERPNRTWHGDAQWNWTISSQQELVVGAEARHDQSTITEYNLSNWAIRDSHISMATYGRGKALTQAEYMEYRRSLTHRLHVTAGGRLDYWKGYDGLSIPALNAAPNVYPERTDASLSGKLAAAYDLGAGWSLRGSAGTAFRNPTVYELYRTWRSSTGTSYLSNPLLEPERLKSWEVGLRKSIGRVFDVDAAYYENWIHNLVYRSTDLADDPTGASQKYFNAGQGRTRGAELALRERVTSWLLLRQTYTITDARIVQNQYVPGDNGRRVPFVPRNISSFSIIAERRGWSGFDQRAVFRKDLQQRSQHRHVERRVRRLRCLLSGGRDSELPVREVRNCFRQRAKRVGPAISRVLSRSRARRVARFAIPAVSRFSFGVLKREEIQWKVSTIIATSMSTNTLILIHMSTPTTSLRTLTSTTTSTNTNMSISMRTSIPTQAILKQHEHEHKGEHGPHGHSHEPEELEPHEHPHKP